MWTKSFRAMGTDVRVCIAARAGVPQGEPYHLFEKVSATIARLEAKFSRFLADSELSQLNAHAGRWMDVSNDMYTVLELAKEAHRRTSGVFDPCIGQVMEEIGYRNTFEDIPSGTAGTAGPSRPTVYLQRRDAFPYALSPAAKQVYLTPGYKIDLGGIAKGWIVERAAEAMRREDVANFILSAGGDMVCDGDNDGVPWHVGIENPNGQPEPILALDVTSSCLATSATYRRQWRLAGERMHHIVDPRSGAPSQSDIASCSVVAESLVAAEVDAKTCLVLGTSVGIDWLNRQEHRGWVIVKTNGDVVHSWNS